MTEDQYTDESADVSQLEQRIDQLEETIRQMLPSRREAIGMGVAGLAGASLMSGTASAGSAQVGTIGDASNLVDLVAEDVTITDSLNTASLASAPAGDALLSDGNGNLQFGAAGGVEEVSTFGNLPAIDPPQLAYVTGEEEYYYSTPIAGFYDIASASFSTDIPTQESEPDGIAWNDDGLRLYESGDNNIHQYTVSSPFDIATASFDTSINTNNNETNARGLAFSNDGTKMVVIIQSPNIIQQYNLSTGFDISTASFDTDIPTQDSSPRGIALNDDGSRLYEVGAGSDKIYQYTVSTPYDIDSASFSTDIPTQDSDPEGIAWNDDGSRLYEVGSSSDRIYQSTVSTPYDIASASFSTDIATQDANPRGIAWNVDGSRLYEVGAGSDKIYQYTVTTGGWEAF